MKKEELRTFQEYSDGNFTKRIVFKEQGSVVFVLNFQPGQGLPPHKHPGTLVHLLILNGAGTASVEGAAHGIREGDILQLEGEEEFSFQNTGNAPMSIYVSLVKIPDERYAQNI